MRSLAPEKSTGFFYTLASKQRQRSATLDDLTTYDSGMSESMTSTSLNPDLANLDPVDRDKLTSEFVTKCFLQTDEEDDHLSQLWTDPNEVPECYDLEELGPPLSPLSTSQPTPRIGHRPLRLSYSLPADRIKTNQETGYNRLRMYTAQDYMMPSSGHDVLMQCHHVPISGEHYRSIPTRIRTQSVSRNDALRHTTHNSTGRIGLHRPKWVSMGQHGGASDGQLRSFNIPFGKLSAVDKRKIFRSAKSTEDTLKNSTDELTSKVGWSSSNDCLDVYPGYYTSPPLIIKHVKETSPNLVMSSDTSSFTRKLSQWEKMRTPSSQARVGRRKSKSVDYGEQSTSLLQLPRQSVCENDGYNQQQRGDVLRRSEKLKSVDKSKKFRKSSYRPVEVLIQAVEEQNLDKVEEILESHLVDPNSVGADGLTPLDIAIFTNNMPIARLLLSNGAKENPAFMRSTDACSLKLISLIKEAERQLDEIKEKICSEVDKSLSPQIKEKENQLQYWTWRSQLYQRMKSGFEQSKPPEVPMSVAALVTSGTSLRVDFEAPSHHNNAIVTRYEVQCSLYEDFTGDLTRHFVSMPAPLFCDVNDLTPEMTYFLRVRAWNMKGWSGYMYPYPAYIMLTSWRQVHCCEPRYEGQLEKLNDLFTAVRHARPASAAHIKDPSELSPAPLRKSMMMKKVRQLLSTAPKFHKSLKRGVYLACVVNFEDKVLVTQEDQIPVVEVDETYSQTTLTQDFNWLMKVSCTWEDVRTLRSDMERGTACNTLHFKSKLLSAVAQLQSCLGIQDLGRLHHSTLRDAHGCVLLITSLTLPDPKQVSATHLHWQSLGKLRLAEDNEGVLGQLMHNIKEVMELATNSYNTLSPGLYLGYLQLESSLDQLKILVRTQTPNTLPCVRVRDRPHVTKEEWEWLQTLSSGQVTSSPSNQQIQLQQQLCKSAQTLLAQLAVQEDVCLGQRLYIQEVIELSPSVSLLCLVPSPNNVCPLVNTLASPLPSGCTQLPVPVFESLSMQGYQPYLMRRYSRLSAILDVESCISKQRQREAFSSEEVFQARIIHERIISLHQATEDIWRNFRWTFDLITFARERVLSMGLPLSSLMAPPPSSQPSPISQRSSDPGYHSGIEPTEDEVEDEVPYKEVMVFSALTTHLPPHTCVRLQITSSTTPRDMIPLVLAQLQKVGVDVDQWRGVAVVLVVVLGVRERVLREDFKLGHLGNPWTQGRLYIRLREDDLAAIEEDNLTMV